MERWIRMSVVPNASIDECCSQGVMGRMQPDRGIGFDLRNAREKTATGSLTNTKSSSI